MSKHTPGPWKLEKCDCGHRACNSWLAGPVLHAEATLSEADARLIAAAPETLETLKEVFASLEKILSGVLPFEVPFDVLPYGAFMRWKKTIAKAEGK